MSIRRQPRLAFSIWYSLQRAEFLYTNANSSKKQAEATDLTKDGTIAFHFKLHGHKHTFEATSAPERNGWFMAAEKIIEEAKASREEMLASPGYKEQLEKLSKFRAMHLI